ncbi:MAG: diphthine--ammonia ligase, partial [Nanoarchaeota archaeon]
MKVGVLYSGGKDSNYALQYALEKGWDIEYLLSVKPTRTDCYLFHFATVEHTKELAQILGIKHILKNCSVADPKKEAEIVKEVVQENPVDAIILGGTGLQVTQIKSIQDALLPLGTETFAAHAGLEHSDIFKQMIEQGYKVMITQIAAEGLTEEWLGKVIDEINIHELFKLSKKYGFHNGGDGSAFETLILDSPLMDQKLVVEKATRYMESPCVGY